MYVVLELSQGSTGSKLAAGSAGNGGEQCRRRAQGFSLGGSHKSRTNCSQMKKFAPPLSAQTVPLT